MPRLEFTTEIAAPQEAVWRFHDDLAVLPKITPPGTRVRINDPPARLEKGVRFTLVLWQSPIPLPLPWTVAYVEYDPPLRFVDEQVKGPFKRWRHEHRFEPLGAGRTLLRDTIDYEAPLGVLGRIADAVFIRRQLNAMFAYRHRVTKQALEASG